MGSMETYLENVALVAARDIVVFDANDLLACGFLWEEFLWSTSLARVLDLLWLARQPM